MEGKMLVVFDIDGTLANIEHRLDYVRSKPETILRIEMGESQLEEI
jgi:hydroxymethylpyrimidine pyrophosphatase-like HAD family hydrolase